MSFTNRLQRSSRLLRLATASLGVAAAVGCSEDLTKPSIAGDRGQVRPPVVTTMVNDVLETTVDASRTDAWVYFDFETRSEVPAADAAMSSTWDLAFQRFKIKGNGGVSGPAGVEVAPMSDAQVEAVSAAPDAGWLFDEGDGPDMNSEPDTVFNRGDDTWFDYDGATHALTARRRVYVVRTAAGGYFAVQLMRYYDAAGTAGFVTFRWKPVNAPAMRIPAAPSADARREPRDGGADGSAADAGHDAETALDGQVETAGGLDASVEGMSVEASSATSWTYLKLGAGVTSPSDSANSTDWDLGFSQAKLRTNGGTSGPGMGAARFGPPGIQFDDVVLAPADGFEVDRLLPNPGPPGSGESSANPVLAGWYDYDPATHRATPKDLVFLIRTASGGQAKLQILSYSRGSYRIRFEPLTAATEP